MSQSEFIVEPQKFFNLLFDESIIVESVEPISEEVLYVTYKKEDSAVEPMSYMNAVIASFTTANCRLKLYDALENLGDRVAYMDTGEIFLWLNSFLLICFALF